MLDCTNPLRLELEHHLIHSFQLMQEEDHQKNHIIQEVQEYQAQPMQLEEDPCTWPIRLRPEEEYRICLQYLVLEMDQRNCPTHL